MHLLILLFGPKSKDDVTGEAVNNNGFHLVKKKTKYKDVREQKKADLPKNKNCVIQSHTGEYF